jgi:hypothetical protein
MYRAALCLSAVLPLALAAAGEPAKGPTLISRPEAAATLVNPQCSHCRDEAKSRAGDLRAAERVLCWIRGYSDGGAIPYRFFLNKYPVISDTYGVFVHDPDAGFARGFAPSLDFSFHGWRNGVIVMKHKDGTLYSCLSGVAFAGPKKGARLAPVPTLVSTWGEWLKRYPQAVAYRMFDKYKAVELPARPAEGSLKSRGPADKRLPAETEVLGVVQGEDARAYPLADLAKAGMIREVVGGQERVVLWYAPTRTAVAYREYAEPPPKTKAKGRRLTFRRPADNPDGVCLTDRETGSRWDVTGRAVEGELKGWTLDWLDGTQVRWFAWAAEYPKTTIHGR